MEKLVEQMRFNNTKEFIKETIKDLDLDTTKRMSEYISNLQNVTLAKIDLDQFKTSPDIDYHYRLYNKYIELQKIDVYLDIQNNINDLDKLKISIEETSKVINELSNLKERNIKMISIFKDTDHIKYIKAHNVFIDKLIDILDLACTEINEVRLSPNTNKKYYPYDFKLNISKVEDIKIPNIMSTERVNVTPHYNLKKDLNDIKEVGSYNIDLTRGAINPIQYVSLNYIYEDMSRLELLELAINTKNKIFTKFDELSKPEQSEEFNVYYKNTLDKLEEIYSIYYKKDSIENISNTFYRLIDAKKTGVEMQILKDRRSINVELLNLEINIIEKQLLNI